MNKVAKDKLAGSLGENGGGPKKSLLKNWKGRDEGEDPGKDGEKK